jgi:hypothetical protein
MYQPSQLDRDIWLDRRTTDWTGQDNREGKPDIDIDLNKGTQIKPVPETKQEMEFQIEQMTDLQ